MSNYPPGVTGNEYQISGAQHEWAADETCPHCGWEGPMPHEFHPQIGTWAWCANPELIEPTTKGLMPCPLGKEGFEIVPTEDEEGLFHP